MPVEQNGIGHSWMTPDKQAGLSAILALQQNIARAVIVKNPRREQTFYHIDAYAGDGCEREGVAGSPILFRNAIRSRSMDYRAYFIDEIRANTFALERTLGNDDRCSIRTGRCEDVVPVVLEEIPTRAYGLLYCDPNSWPDMDMVRTVATCNPTIDILLRIPATTLKRIRCEAATRNVNVPNLAEQIASIPKRKWIVRGPVTGDPQQWTFIFGTNYTDFPQWEKHGFVHITSEQGRHTMARLALTKKELLAQQETLDLMRKDDAEPFAIVSARSGGTCERCHERPATQFHHTSYPAKDTAANLLHLCHGCHCRIHGVTR